MAAPEDIPLWKYWHRLPYKLYTLVGNIFQSNQYILFKRSEPFLVLNIYIHVGLPAGASYFFYIYININ